MNTITSDAAPHELRSPYYVENKRICEEWEHFVLNHQGTSQGKYTAWALILRANWETKWKVNILLKKSTTSNAAIFFSSQKNAFARTSITVGEVDMGEHVFRIHAASWTDSIRTITGVQQYAFKDQLRVYARQTYPNVSHPILLGLKNLDASAKLESVHYDPRDQTLNIHFQGILMDFEWVRRVFV